MNSRENKKKKNRGTATTEYILIAVIAGTALIAACKNLGGGLKNNIKTLGETIEQAKP